jgi:hypothetical protein
MFAQFPINQKIFKPMGKGLSTAVTACFLVLCRKIQNSSRRRGRVVKPASVNRHFFKTIAKFDLARLWKKINFSALYLALAVCTASAGGEAARCPFDESKLSFDGTPLEQAKCLLRTVKQGGVLGKTLAKLPAPLENLVGQPVALDKTVFQNYLQKNHIAEEDIGGSITNDLPANYFVIHDVSAPNYLDKPFPPDINQASWGPNNVGRWKKTDVAHIFVTRLGESTSPHPFVVPWRATKFETRILKEKSKGLFVHIELVQPRRSNRRGSPNNDTIAPKPGFTEKQLDRLALLYVSASLAHGTWMVPAFHATIDAGIPGAHDDPQNFDLTHWAKRLNVLIKSLQPKAEAK